MIKLYTSPTCPTCKMIKTKLATKQIEYEEVNDLETLRKNNIQRLPVMELDNGEMISSPLEMNEWIKNYGG